MQINELLDTFPQTYQPFHTGFGGGIQVRPYHTAVFTVIHIAVHNGVGVIFHIGVSRDRSVDGFALAQLRQLGLLVGAANVLHGIMQLIGKLQPLDGVHGVVHAVSGAFRLLSAQYHFRVVQEIAVDGKAVLGLSGLRPLRHNVQRAVSLLQEDDVRYNLGPRIGLKRIVGQTDSPQQLGALGQIPAHSRILGVHRISAGDKGHHATGTHLVQRLGKKVIVNAEIQLVIGFVPNLVLAKRNIAHRQIVEIPPVGGFKPGHGDVCLGIELLGNTPADGIQLHAVQTAVSHFLRQHTEEIAHTTGRLQDVAGLKSHTAHSLVNRFDDRRAGVVRVEGGTSGSGIFLRGQQLLQLGIFLAPAFLVGVKGIGKAAPAHIPGQDFLLFRRCLPGGFL